MNEKETQKLLITRSVSLCLSKHNDIVQLSPIFFTSGSFVAIYVINLIFSYLFLKKIWIFRNSLHIYYPFNNIISRILFVKSCALFWFQFYRQQRRNDSDLLKALKSRNAVSTKHNERKHVNEEEKSQWVYFVACKILDSNIRAASVH